MGEPAATLRPIWCSGCGRLYDPIDCPRYCECDCGTDTDDMELAPDWLIELRDKLAELQKPCVWHDKRLNDDAEEIWRSSCTSGFVTKDRDFIFCPHCGHKIEVKSE